jgi:SAM-dependent methyltransferase
VQECDQVTRKRIAARYGRWPGLRSYAACKLAWDPAYRAVLDRLHGSSLPVLDIGCGIGLLALYLRDHGFAAPLRGVDLASDKVAIARDVLGQQFPDTALEAGDASLIRDFFGNVVLLDVLHYFDPAAQRAFLERVAGMVAPDGVILIRIGIRDGSVRYAMTWLEELFVRASRWIIGGAWNFPTIDEVAAPFRERGFRESIAPLWGRTPFNSYLFEFRPRSKSTTSLPSNQYVTSDNTGVGDSSDRPPRNSSSIRNCA